jgi:hypothetical protein
MAGVRVEISATTDKLQAGVDQASDILDSLSKSVDTVKDAFLALGAVTVGAVSFEGLKSTFDQLASYADSVQNMQATVGGSLESLTTLSGVASLTGTSFGGLGRDVSNAALEVQKAGKDAWTPGAQALRELGLSAKDLVGLPADQWLMRVSDAVTRFNPSAQLTANVTAAFGRGFAELMPLLMQGSDSFREMEASVRKAQQGLASTLPGISETEAKLTMLKLSSQAFAAQIFTALKPAIDSAIDGFAKLTQSVTIDDIRDTANSIANALVDIAASVAKYLVQAGVEVDLFKAKFAGLKITLPESDDREIRSALSWITWATGSYDHFKETLSKPLPGITIGTVGGDDPLAKLPEQLKAIEDGATAAHDKINNVLPVSGSWRATGQDMANLNREVLAAAESFGKLNAQSLNLGGRSGVEAAISGINAQIAAENAAYQTQVEHIDSLAKTFQVSETTKSTMLLQALEQRHTAQLISVAEESEIAGMSVQQHQKMYDEFEKIEAKYNSDHQKLLDQQFQSDVKSWNSLLQPIESAWNSQLRGLLAGTTSWSTAMKNIFSSLVIDAIQGLEKLAVEQAAIGLAKSVGSPLSSMLGGLGSSAATTANTTAMGLLTTALSANTIALGGETVATTTETAASGASSVGGIAGILKSLFTFLPGFATGSWEVPSTMAAMIHPGEMIIPSGPAAQLRTAWGGGGSSGGGSSSSGGGMNVGISMNVSAFNPSGMQATINAMMPQLARALQRYQGLNPSTS